MRKPTHVILSAARRAKPKDLGRLRKAVVLILTLGVSLLALARDWVDVPGPKYRGRDLVLPGIVQKPEGAGPFPGVVILHGCKGIQEESDGRWAQRFNDMGYAVLMVDSFRPRGYIESCNLNVTQTDRARDAFAAKKWFAAQPYVQAGKIGLFGISHGGFGALTAANSANYPHDEPFVAVVALYPYCGPSINVLGSPLRILIGDADQLTEKKRCEDMKINYPEGHEYKLSIYPGATHFFDIAEIVELVLRMPNRDTSVGADPYMQVHVRHDAGLTAKAAAEVREFFGKYLQ